MLGGGGGGGGRLVVAGPFTIIESEGPEIENCSACHNIIGHFQIASELTSLATSAGVHFPHKNCHGITSH